MSENTSSLKFSIVKDFKDFGKITAVDVGSFFEGEEIVVHSKVEAFDISNTNG